MQTRCPHYRQYRAGAGRRRRILALTAVGGALTAAVLTGCSGASDDSDSGGASIQKDAVAAALPDAAAERSASDAVGSVDGQPSSEPVVVTGPALIKTAAIELKTDAIQHVIDRIYGLALTTGGRVDSEQTSTDADGTVDHSRLQVRVPVDSFDDAVGRIYTMAREHTKQTSTDDVTAKLADVTSRVESAQASIQQLRQLFDRAKSLGNVIRLERELSQREADLESLQAQQRSLEAQTTMSTILVTITLPPPVAAAPAGDGQAGFVSGIEKGWDALVTFVIAVSHTIGLALPLSVLAGAVGLALWLLVRRFSPRRDRAPQPSE
jgi:hypothetical protein